MLKTSMLAAALFSAMAAPSIAAAAPTIISLAGTDSIGVTLQLAAGTYDLSEIGGAYTAADLWTNSGTPAVTCASSAAGTCKYGYVSNLDVTVNGTTTLYATPAPAGQSRTYGVYDTAANALSAFQSTVGAIDLTLTAPSTVNFKVADLPTNYWDNSGGLTLSLSQVSPAPGSNVSAAPEPGTWALMIVGLGVAGVAMRRRSSLATLAA